jgi:hypothetical protein
VRAVTRTRPPRCDNTLYTARILDTNGAHIPARTHTTPHTCMMPIRAAAPHYPFVRPSSDSLDAAHCHKFVLHRIVRRWRVTRLMKTRPKPAVGASHTLPSATCGSARTPRRYLPTSELRVGGGRSRDIGVSVGGSGSGRGVSVGVNEGPAAARTHPSSTFGSVKSVPWVDLLGAGVRVCVGVEVGERWTLVVWCGRESGSRWLVRLLPRTAARGHSGLTFDIYTYPLPAAALYVRPSRAALPA